MENLNMEFVVQNFENLENPTYNDMVLAYYCRDVQMNIQLNDVANHVISKLRLDPQNYVKYIKQKFVYEQRLQLNQFAQNDDDNQVNYQANFDNQYINNHLQSEEFLEKENKYNVILNYINNNGSHEDFYKLFTHDELIYLGW